MAWIDIILMLILLRAAYVGFRKGAFVELFKIVGLLIGLILALYYSEEIGTGMASFFSLPSSPVLFIIFFCLLGCCIAAFSFLRTIIFSIMKIELIGIFERVTGLILGVVRGSLISSLILLILVSAPSPYFAQLVNEQSWLGPRLLTITPRLCEKLIDSFPWVGH